MKKLIPITLAVAALAVGVVNLVLPGASATTTATFKVVKSTVNVTGWEVALDYSGTTPFTLTAYAVCN